jgi:deazaflavin-dependent oxidoreductase (nitroreductase family)
MSVSVPRPPLVVRLFDPVMRWLLGSGFPMGPNTLLTVRGRRSGQPRSAGVAILEVGGRRWITGAYGEVQWVRNLRAAGEGEIRVKGRSEHVRVQALTHAEAAAFYRDTLRLYYEKLPLPGKWAASLFAGDALRDPEAAAETHPVFELYRASDADPQRGESAKFTPRAR